MANSDREFRIAYDREYRARPEVRARRRAHRLSEPERERARKKVANELRHGRLTPTPCIRCGGSPVQAHHHKGYEPEFVLDVLWLCAKCHRHVHLEAAA